MKRSLVKTVLFALTAVLLSAFAIQKKTEVWSFRPLEGVFVHPPQPDWSFKTFRTGEYQSQLESYLKESFGLREPLIRLYNQYLWDFYRKTFVSIDQLVFGKDEWLYEPGAVGDYYQRQFFYFAEDSAKMASMLTKEAQRLRLLQEVLETHGTHLLVCQVPSKDLIYPEYLPADQDTNYIGQPRISPRFFNEEEYTRLGVNHLNLEQYFLQMKDTADFLLFPKTGMHWSRYASLYAADTLIRYMEHLGEVNMKNFVIENRELDDPRGADNDLECLLNLQRPIRKPKYYYADCITDDDTTSVKPKMIVIGDSFWWTIAVQLPLNDIFSIVPYWYYNSTIYYDSRYNSVSQVNLADELLTADFVVLAYCATQQYRMNDGFTQQALEALGVECAAMDSTERYEREVQHVIGDILANPNAMKSIREKAVLQNKTVEKTVRDDAAWIVNNKMNKK